MESKAILYHSNTSKECKKFIDDKKYLVISQNEKDDIWLGRGMYFWDNYGNAKWWNEKQYKRNPEEKYEIVRANVNMEKMLDLTDYEVYVTMEHIWQEICVKLGIEGDIPLGNKLNIMMDYKFKTAYSVIKVIGKYNNTKAYGLFKFDYRSRKAEPTMTAKCIYNVRKSECIIETEYVNDGGKHND